MDNLVLVKPDSENECSPKKSKRLESTQNEKQAAAARRKNFIIACEKSSHNAYFDHKKRFMMYDTPDCILNSICNHQNVDKNKVNDSLALNIKKLIGTTLALNASVGHLHQDYDIAAIGRHIQDGFRIELQAHAWCDSLELCEMAMNENSFLPDDILRDVAEIILNAHEDEQSLESHYILSRARFILTQMYLLHPPCLLNQIRKTYQKFLTSPLSYPMNSFSNRFEFQSDKGIAIYCFCRLKSELEEKKDGPIVDKEKSVPEEMKQTVRGLQWQRDNFEIYETLPRDERIYRLITVLEGIIELLAADLAIWNCRHRTNQGRHIMRSHRPLMAHVLWSDNILYTGAVNSVVRLIIDVFVTCVELGFDKYHMTVFVEWINAVVQTFYICERDSGSDYPHTGKHCANFAKEMYRKIKDLPVSTQAKLLENINPNYMTHLIGMHILKEILKTNEDDILKITYNFLKNRVWSKYSTGAEAKKAKVEVMRVKTFEQLISYCEEIARSPDKYDQPLTFPKRKDVNSEQTIEDLGRCNSSSTEATQSEVIHILVLTLKSYLDAYSVANVQKTLEKLNENIMKEDSVPNAKDDFYFVTEAFIKKYRTIFKSLQEIILLMLELKQDPDFKKLKPFQSIRVLC